MRVQDNYRAFASRPPLVDGIVRRIEAHPEQRIPFSEFMEVSLFDPDAGYYTTREGKIGAHSRSSDFGTYPEKAPVVFGAGLARQYHEMWVTLGRPSRLQIVEMGAGNGTMARATLERLRDKFDELYAAVRYVIVEISTELRGRQRNLLQEFVDVGKVLWVSGSAIELPDPEGVLELGIPRIFTSNELPDAFPVDRVRFNRENGRYEMAYVTADGGRLKEVFGPIPSTHQWDAYLATIEALDTKHLQVLQAGGEIPVNFGALRWIERVGASLQRGYVVTIDYGYPRGEFPCEGNCVRVYAVAKPMFFLGIRITSIRLLAILKELRWEYIRRLSLLRPYSLPRRIAYHLNVFRHLKDDVRYMYEAPGEVDLTADVDFTLLAAEAKQWGLEVEGLMTQSEFFEKQRIRGKALQLVFNPAFYVLVQSKGVDTGLYRRGDWFKPDESARLSIESRKHTETANGPSPGPSGTPRSRGPLAR